jgi:hypothetical protein
LYIYLVNPAKLFRKQSAPRQSSPHRSKIGERSIDGDFLVRLPDGLAVGAPGRIANRSATASAMFTHIK